MAPLLTLSQFGNPILRTRAKRVKLADTRTPSFLRFVADMFATMHDPKHPGVGLAAPQVGKSLQLAVIEVAPSKLRPHAPVIPPTTIINPKIVKHSKGTENDWEGCLSCSGIRGIVPRYRSVSVEYYGLDGHRYLAEASGFAARVFQHEVDHLHGILFVDRMRDMKTLMTEDEFRRQVGELPSR